MVQGAADRPAAMKEFMDQSYNIDLLDGSRVSDRPANRRTDAQADPLL
jgi:hypothetical protein